MWLEKEPAGSAALERGWRAALAYVLHGNDRVRWSRLPAESSDRVPGIQSCPAYVGSVAREEETRNPLEVRDLMTRVASGVDPEETTPWEQVARRQIDSADLLRFEGYVTEIAVTRLATHAGA